ncbi:MAG: hypothetical protein FJ082_05095 [Cyanobacteria bacterium K_Offshore_surface_m2_011]|nr:hypothetical protein [Cyanobacteria bacterium K_Offshore_surface_m2_011]
MSPPPVRVSSPKPPIRVSLVSAPIRMSFPSPPSACSRTVPSLSIRSSPLPPKAMAVLKSPS